MNTGLLTTIIVVMAIYFLVMAGIGYYGKKYSKTFADSLNASKNVGMLMVIFSSVGAHVGNGFVVGGAGDGASMGLGGALYGLGCAASYIVTALLVGKYLYRGNYVSLKDYLYERYGDNLPGIVYDISTTLSYIGNVAAQLMAGYALFEALGLPGAYGVIAIAIVVFIYTQLGGLWGSISTGTIQTIIIFVALIITSIVILGKGGIDTIKAAQNTWENPDGAFKLFSMALPVAIGTTVPTTMSTLVDQGVIQRMNSSKDEKAAVWGHIVGGIILIPLAFLPTFVGMYGHAVYGATDKTAFFNVLFNDLPPILAAIAVTAVVAAVMSTISSFYNAFSATIIKDIYHDLINPKADEKQLKLYSVVLAAIITVISIAIAISSSSIIGVLTSTYVFIGAACLIPFLGGIVWKKGNAKGAVASSIVGVITCLLDMAGILKPTYESLFPLLPALVAYVVVSLITQNKTTASVETK